MRMKRALPPGVSYPASYPLAKLAYLRRTGLLLNTGSMHNQTGCLISGDRNPLTGPGIFGDEPVLT